MRSNTLVRDMRTRGVGSAGTVTEEGEGRLQGPLQGD